MRVIDSHCHLNFPDFKDDLPHVLASARAHGVGGFLSICTHLGEAREIQEIAGTFDDVVCSVGIHPHGCEKEEEVRHAYEKKDASFLATCLKEKIQSPRVVALGETGLDFYYETSHQACQMFCFAAHIQVSLELDLPLVVHTRQAEDQTVDLLRGEGRGKAKGVIHCFTGTLDMARACLELGFYISISGIITFKNASALREVVSFVPLDRLLVETDAPYLAPIPYRGKRNEPAYVVHTLRAVADLKGIPVEEAAHQTTENFFKLFSKASFREGRP